MFDFILFENLQGATNHYKDISLISRMLKDAGFSVAIATLYDERKYCDIDDIQLIEVSNTQPVPDNNWLFKPKNKIHSFFCVIKYLYQQHRYLKEFLNNIRGLAKNYYVGSYHTLVSSLLLKEATNDKKVFFWGLRSSRISGFWQLFISDPVGGLRFAFLRNFVYKNNNLIFFISNEIIRREFIELGISSERLIIREERFFNDCDLTNDSCKANNFTLLSIGLLRKSKRIEMLIDAFRKAAGDEDEYIIAGKCLHEDYSIKISETINADKRIKRINDYIDETRFNDLFNQCHYLLLGDMQDKSSVTNGTMLEALIHKRPIIAPNHDPYKYYVEKFHIGLLYDEHDANNLDYIIKKAKKLPVDYFDASINDFLNSINYEKCLREVSNEIKIKLNAR